MPHFVVDCSQGIVRQRSGEEILARLHRAVNSTGLFEEPDIKVRINPFPVYAVGGGKEDFIHVFSYIMQGRTIGQRADLSRKIVSELADLFPAVHRIATNIAEFEKATYLNRDML
jgi:5-carboxymethyl-2-hydroxymuconate isomerase